ISLGGWLRALEIACAASLKPYDPAKAATLGKPEVVEYFVFNLETLEPRLQKNQLVSQIRARLVEIHEATKIPEGQILAEDEVLEIHTKVEALVDRITGAGRLINSTQTTGAPATGAPP